MPPTNEIVRDAFRFDGKRDANSLAMLPLRLQQLGVPENFKQQAAALPNGPQLETLAELIVALTEDAIKAISRGAG